MIEQFGLIEFFHLLPDAPLPAPADPSLDGSIPLRAFKYCEPFTSANSFGWHLFPPLDFDIRWDGHACVWRRATANEQWSLLHTVTLPEFAEQLKTQESRGQEQYPGVIPFMSYTPEYGIIQIWSGLVVRSKPGWVSLVRPLVNYPHESAFDLFDGIIETDWWTGPLFSVIRITKSDLTIEFRTRRPFAQLQLVHRDAYLPETMRTSRGVTGVERWPADLAADFRATLTEFSNRRRAGDYKRAARARREQ